MIRRRLLGVPVILILLATSSWAFAQTATGGQAWIDQPLGWVIITSNSVKVTAHATHPNGVTQVRLDVDGVTLAESGAGGGSLEAAEFDWNPPGSGTYLLEVFGFADGGWGNPGSVAVSVQHGSTEPESPTTTTTQATTTTRVTTTSTQATTTTCVMGTPNPTGPLGSVVTLGPTLTWSYVGCSPGEFEIQVSREPGFPRLEWTGIAPGSARSIEVAVSANCTAYFWRIRTLRDGVAGPWSPTSEFFVALGRC